ncbi:hypothetical protein ACXR0O_08700 [Verrucomicrobiota bacterium sgz303538]
MEHISTHSHVTSAVLAALAALKKHRALKDPIRPGELNEAICLFNEAIGADRAFIVYFVRGDFSGQIDAILLVLLRILRKKRLLRRNKDKEMPTVVVSYLRELEADGFIDLATSDEILHAGLAEWNEEISPEEKAEINAAFERLLMDGSIQQEVVNGRTYYGVAERAQ